ncbi:MAG UNVERIFIED_CONTAM: hypothetical protein LVR29_21765 [Microcystis novacekii LVE1205-3]
MEWLRARMWDDKVMATFLKWNNVSTRQAFINQKVAMVEDGSWALRDILVGANFRIGVAPFQLAAKKGDSQPPPMDLVFMLGQNIPKRPGS